jgi:hypothetical protein
MDVRLANLVPARATTPAQAAALVQLDGAAIVAGITTVDEAVAFGYAMLGERAVRVAPQFEATKARYDVTAPVVAAQPVDHRGRKRAFTAFDQIMPAHNDGYAFGDHAPDHIFLWCGQPCPTGGASFVVDALKLATIVGADDPEMAEFLWRVPIDHSEPNFPLPAPAPIARITPGGRAQVRSHPYQLPVEGPGEAAQMPFVERWGQAVRTARDTGPRVRLAAGELLCVDNYRMLHGRDAYQDQSRHVVSIWGWTHEAVAVPQMALDITEPKLDELTRV